MKRTVTPRVTRTRRDQLYEEIRNSIGKEVVIPTEVRERLKLKPGQKVAVVEKDGVVHLIPVRPLKELKGIVAGMSSKGPRERNRALIQATT